MKPLIIGQAPARNGDPEKPLVGRSGKKLAELMGVSEESFYRSYDRVNVYGRYMGKQGKGDAFPKPSQGQIAHLIEKLKFQRRPFVLFVGQKTAKAFGFDTKKTGFLWLKDHIGTKCAVLPHPSGVNRWWNDGHNVVEASMFLCNMEKQRLKLEGENAAH